jgi:DNA-binding MarR family transcriptional regulator
MAEVNPHIGQLLRDAYRRFDEELAAGLSAPRARLGVRPAHDAVLAYLDRDGTRASVLAERSRLTRQAITQLVDELEERGVVTRRPDPSDGRAKIIQYTPEALKHFDASRRVIAALERRWASELGRRNYAALRVALEQLLREHED